MGPPAHSRDTSRSLVPSPRAAKMGAEMPKPAPAGRGLGRAGDIALDVLVAGMRDLPAHARARRERRAGEVDAEPGAEPGRVGQRAPDLLAGDAEDDLVLDTVPARRGHRQPPGCIIAGRPRKCSRSVAWAEYLGQLGGRRDLELVV